MWKVWEEGRKKAGINSKKRIHWYHHILQDLDVKTRSASRLVRPLITESWPQATALQISCWQALLLKVTASWALRNCSCEQKPSGQLLTHLLKNIQKTLLLGFHVEGFLASSHLSILSSDLLLILRPLGFWKGLRFHPAWSSLESWGEFYSGFSALSLRHSPKCKLLCPPSLCVLPLILLSVAFLTQPFPWLLVPPYGSLSGFSAPSTSSQSTSSFHTDAWLSAESIANFSLFTGGGEAAHTSPSPFLGLGLRMRWGRRDRRWEHWHSQYHSCSLMHGPLPLSYTIPFLPCHSHLLNSCTCLHIYGKLGSWHPTFILGDAIHNVGT